MKDQRRAKTQSYLKKTSGEVIVGKSRGKPAQVHIDSILQAKGFK
jgi:hypothetical protein